MLQFFEDWNSNFSLLCCVIKLNEMVLNHQKKNWIYYYCARNGGINLKLYVYYILLDVKNTLIEIRNQLSCLFLFVTALCHKCFISK